MNQMHLHLSLDAALARNAGATLTTHLAPYERRRGYYTVAELKRSDGSLIKRAAGTSKTSAIDNLDVALSLR